MKNKSFGDYLHTIYPNELEIKDTTDSSRSASYLDIFLQMTDNDNLCTKLYDKGDDFNFAIVNFPFLDSIFFFSIYSPTVFIVKNIRTIDRIFVVTKDGFTYCPPAPTQNIPLSYRNYSSFQATVLFKQHVKHI